MASIASKFVYVRCVSSRYTEVLRGNVGKPEADGSVCTCVGLDLDHETTHSSDFLIRNSASDLHIAIQGRAGRSCYLVTLLSEKQAVDAPDSLMDGVRGRQNSGLHPAHAREQRSVGCFRCGGVWMVERGRVDVERDWARRHDVRWDDTFVSPFACSGTSLYKCSGRHSASIRRA